MTERLSALLQRFELRARVLHGSALCGVSRSEQRHGTGHLHLLRQGTLAVTGARTTVMVVDELIAGLADPRLHRVLAAVHAEPAQAWTLSSMAAVAGMPRARFAAHFASRVGVPAGEYLTGWRADSATH